MSAGFHSVCYPQTFVVAFEEIPKCFPLNPILSPTRVGHCQNTVVCNKFCGQSGPSGGVSLKPSRHLKSINNLAAPTPACHSCWSVGHALPLAQPANSLLLLPRWSASSQLEFFLTFKYGKMYYLGFFSLKINYFPHQPVSQTRSF